MGLRAPAQHCSSSSCLTNFGSKMAAPRLLCLSTFPLSTNVASSTNLLTSSGKSVLTAGCGTRPKSVVVVCVGATQRPAGTEAAAQRPAGTEAEDMAIRTSLFNTASHKDDTNVS